MAQLKEHFDRTLEYGEHLGAREVWTVHFTCMDGATASPLWPSSEQIAAGLNVVHFWHNLEFQSLRMSSHSLNINGEIIVDQDFEHVKRDESQ